MDLRAHGSSGGEKFYLGMQSSYDVLNILDSLYKMPETDNVVMMGKGIGAGIVIEAAALDHRQQTLILQSPYNSMENYLKSYATEKWGVLNYFLYPVSSRNLQRQIGVKIRDINMVKKIKKIENPLMVVIGEEDELISPDESKRVYIASPSMNKQIMIVKEAGHDNIDLIEGDAYFNKLSIFMVRSFPKQPKKSRFKKLA
jgi:hypothetical protein